MELVITTQEVRMGDYRASHADFLSDYGSAPPAPAHPNCTRIYRHGELHASETPGAQRAGGPRIWPEGDAIIAALPTLLTKQTARQEAAQQAAQQAAAEAARQAAAEAAQRRGWGLGGEGCKKFKAHKRPKKPAKTGYAKTLLAPPKGNRKEEAKEGLGRKGHAQDTLPALQCAFV